jgi:hypothetical protein
MKLLKFRNYGKSFYFSSRPLIGASGSPDPTKTESASVPRETTTQQKSGPFESPDLLKIIQSECYGLLSPIWASAASNSDRADITSVMCWQTLTPVASCEYIDSDEPPHEQVYTQSSSFTEVTSATLDPQPTPFVNV